MTDQTNTPDITPTEADLARDLRAFYQRFEVEKDAELHCSYGVWPTLLAALRRAIAAEAELKQLKTGTYCAYCGHTEPIDGDGERVAEHIRTCERHPMRAVETRVKELEAELQRLREDAEDQRLEWQFRDTCGE